MTKPFTIIAIVVFIIVGMLHLMRYLLGWEIIVNSVVMPMWISLPGFVIAAGLAVMLWQEMK